MNPEYTPTRKAFVISHKVFYEKGGGLSVGHRHALMTSVRKEIEKGRSVRVVTKRQNRPLALNVPFVINQRELVPPQQKTTPKKP